jgi:hypothetical protein
MRRMLKVLLLVGLVVGSIPVGGGAASAGSGRTLFIDSAIEHPDKTVTFPLHRGVSGGRTVWFVVLDASTSNIADRFGVNRSNKLANAAGTTAVQRITIVDGIWRFPATVDFRPERIVEAPNGFPPTRFQAGAVAEAGYSPLVRLPGGAIVNAPHLANDTGVADKVVSMDRQAGTVRYAETAGFQDGRPVLYVSTEASNPLAAALEGVTLAPALDAAPFAGGDGTDSSRASLAAFVNGQTGVANPQRQGLNSAVEDGLDPLNVLAWNPSQGRYSPLWDVHLAAWTQRAIDRGLRTRQEDFSDIEDFGEEGAITSPGGSAFGAAGFVVNCPIVSRAG